MLVGGSMKKKFFNWLNRNKSKDTFLWTCLKLLYKMSIDAVHGIINVILGLFFGEYFGSESWGSVLIISIVIVLVEIYFYFVRSYKDYNYSIRKNSNLILNEITAATVALDDYIITNNDSGKGIFQYASNIVTASLYDVLKQITGSETRISVIQQFHDKRKRYCLMISRKSQKRTSSSKERQDIEYSGKKNNYYYLKVLKENETTYIFFETKEAIDNIFYWPNKKKKRNIFQYIGVAEKVKTNDIAFLLQIDAMEKDSFGKTQDDLSAFADEYIYPYIQFLKHAYNLERTMRKDDENEKGK